MNTIHYVSYIHIFSRCCEKKSCGNRNETPSDPVVIDRSVPLMLKSGMGSKTLVRQLHIARCIAKSGQVS